jgi:hypothetical protein
MSEHGFLPDVGCHLVEVAADEGITIRLIGGVAIWLHSSEEARRIFGRDYPDLDFVGHERESRRLRKFLEEQGYVGDKLFNAMHGAQRLLYRHPEQDYQIDIFLDKFNMSHNLDLSGRLDVESPTLPAAELLLTKMQIVEINQKDVSDMIMLLWSHHLGDEDGPGELNIEQVAKLCAADWGLYTTVSDNLIEVRKLLPEVLAGAAGRDAVAGKMITDADVAGVLTGRIEFMLMRLESYPKSFAWKIRAVLGRRVRWYEVPEEVRR